jgi:hypothetical protein
MSNKWANFLDQASQAADIDEREARIMRISSDPRPQYKEPVQKNYPQTEMHNIICVDEENANLSMPEASERGPDYEHKLGGVLASDRKEVPYGWIKKPPTGTPIESIKEQYPELYDVLVEKKVTNF